MINVSNTTSKGTTPKFIISTHHNVFYRFVGYLILVLSIYVLLSPLVTGVSIKYRGELDMTLFAVPGIILGLLALIERKVNIDINNKKITLSYQTLSIPIYLRTNAFTNYSSIELVVDAKNIPYSTHPGSHPSASKMLPWYVLKLVSASSELLICKSTNSKKIKHIADLVSTKIPLTMNTDEFYPA